MSWDGSNRLTLNSVLPNPVGVTFLGDTLFCADANLKQVLSLAQQNASDAYDVTVRKSGMENLVALAAYSDSGPTDGNSCSCIHVRYMCPFM